MTDDENRAYNKGYQAALRRYQKELAQLDTRVSAAETTKYERVYLSVLNGLLAAGRQWLLADEPVTRTDQYCDLAKRFADKVMRHL